MSWIIHPKATAAMVAVFASLAGVLTYVIKDTTVLAVLLFVIFSLVLLAGNIYISRTGTGPARPSGPSSLRHASRTRDPELGRR